MTELPVTREASERLSHLVESHNDYIARGTIDQCINHIENGTGSPAGCLRTLKSFAEISAFLAWYQEGDLVGLKNWFYVRAKLEYILMHTPYNEVGGTQAYENRALHGLYYLVSDNSDLIKWYAGLDSLFDAKRINNSKVFDFWTEQFFLALRGEWEILAARCERIIAEPPAGSREKKFLIDHRFYLALAEGDVIGMTSAIKELVAQKTMVKRVALESGFSSGLICTPAIIYCKIAWNHGYKIEIESPYIPAQWLPNEPLRDYVDPFDFMKSHRIG